MTSAFDPTAYGPVVADLLGEPRLMPLGPGQPHEPFRDKLQGLSPATVFPGQRVRDTDMAAGCCAALWLYHDFLDESHTISQSIETATGGYWHGILHRREPDYGNAKYWFRRVGRHPVFDTLHGEVAAIAAAGELPPSAAFLATNRMWDPFAFIDLCEESAAGRAPAEMLCRRIQQREWEVLFDYCYRQALAG
jgi:hypothetical protein